LLTEAKKTYPKNVFLNLDMINLSKIKQKFSYIFFIASFHHLNNLKDRKKVLKNAYKLLDDD
jgi:predicted kinase